MSTADLDPAAILSGLGVTGARSITPVTGGMDTAIWRVEHDGGRSALRVFRPDQQGACQREVAAMRAATAAGLPVPAVQAEGRWGERPIMLLAWCPGRTMMEVMLAQPQQAERLALLSGRLLARIHQVPLPAAWEANSTRWITWAGPDEAPLQARLQALPLTTSLLHMDYHPLNLMVDGGRITGILDWTNAYAGDPRADLARGITILRIIPAWRDGPIWLPPNRRRRIDAAFRRGYRQVAGPVRQMALFYAWAGALMARDLGPRPERPATWVQPHQLAAIRHWTAGWKRRAGLDAVATGDGGPSGDGV
jgi:aminoglycoside phosphotransferase (APT) family kinase protein